MCSSFSSLDSWEITARQRHASQPTPHENGKTQEKDARDTHACCGVVATYQNREGVRLAPGRRAHIAARHWTAAGHW